MSKEAWQGVAIVLVIAIAIMCVPMGRALPQTEAANSVIDKAFLFKPHCPPDDTSDPDGCIYYRQALDSEAANATAKEMARDGRAAMIASWIAAAFACITAVVAWLALRDARDNSKLVQRSVEASEKSSEAAIEAAKRAGDLVKADRAWMTVRQEPFQFEASATGGEVYRVAFHPKIKWYNSGRSPALNFTTYVVLAACEKDALPPPVYIPPMRKGLPVPVGVELSPREDERLSNDDLLAWANEKKKIGLYSSCSYADVFDPDVTRQSSYFAWIFAERVKHEGGYELHVYIEPVDGLNFVT